ncbi:unnamed protein product [Medioppia subpectinata]|uniref:Uncharacterized protein n=1 Tax=Medioppia subpectinata TaxID=1979941 RepID=A0A7R9KEC7_9ACAR|nr:unnamed protein product [Medioppia subpectinata]CAG2101828.1 unnamed protein product [Medioppia subpectinata]
MSDKLQFVKRVVKYFLMVTYFSEIIFSMLSMITGLVHYHYGHTLVDTTSEHNLQTVKDLAETYETVEKLGPVLYVIISVAVMSVMVYFVVVTYYEWPKQSIVVAVLLILLMVAYLMIGDIDARTAIGILLPAIMALIYAYLIDRELKSRQNCLQTAGYTRDGGSDVTLELCLPHHINDDGLPPYSSQNLA